MRMFRGPDYAPAGRIELHSDADNIRFDRSANLIIVGYGSGGLAVINAANNSSVGSMPLKAHPESFQLDPKTSDVFVNLPDERAMVVLDRLTGQERSSWRVATAAITRWRSITGRDRVLTVFRDRPKLAASRNKRQAAGEADTCGDVDDLFIDAKRQRIYISCGEGFIDVRDARDPAYRTARCMPDGELVREHLSSSRNRSPSVGGARTSRRACGHLGL